MSEDAIIALLVIMLVLCVATATTWSLTLRFRRRQLLHREWMAALEKGMPLPDLAAFESAERGPRLYLLKGLVWLACGLTLSIFIGALWLTTWERPPVSAQIRDAQALRELGYSTDEIRRLIPFQPQREPDFPVGLSLVGIVPAGIGVAYMIFYHGESSRSL